MITDCIRSALKDGFISKEKAQEATEAYDDLVAAGMDPTAAAQKMKTAVKSAKTAERFAAIKRAKLAYQLDKQIKGLDRDGVYEFLPRFLETVSKNADQSYKGLLLQKIAEVIEASNPKFAGLFRPMEHMDGVVRALYDGKGTAEEKAMADGVKAMNDFIVQLMKANGVHIDVDPDFRLPQIHSKSKMENKSQWVDDHMGNDVLDWDKMSDFNDGKPINTEADKVRVLEEVWLTLRSDGANKIDSGATTRGALSTKYSHQRFLRYKTVDSWLKMQGLYGEGDPFQSIVNYADRAALDIALSQALGPAPKSMFQFITNNVLRRASNLMDSGEKARGYFTEDKLRKSNLYDEVATIVKLTDEMYDEITHANSASYGNLWARAFQVIRTGIVSSWLGGTGILSIVTDNMGRTFSSNYDKTATGKYMKQYFRLMNPLSDTDRKIALRSGLGFDAAIKMAAGAERYHGEIFAPMWARRISDVAMRLNFLTPHTQSAQWAYALEFMGTLADNANKAFDDLPFVEIMKDYDITPADWDQFKVGPVFGEGTFNMLRIADVFKRTDLSMEQQSNLFAKFSSMMYTQREFSIPTKSLRGETALKGRARAGTIPGEATLSFKMFKSFPMTVWNTHYRRTINMSLMGKAAYLGGYGAALTMGGAMSLQLLSLSQGRDFEEMDSDFWGRASLKGGGVGIIADIIYGAVNKYGGLQASIGGPVAQFLQDTGDLTIGNFIQLFEDGDTNFAKEFVRYLDTYAPAVNAAPIQLIKRRLFDELYKEFDPKAYTRFMRMEEQAEERGGGYWWRPGELTPYRAPDPSSMLPNLSQ